ncbi:MAG: protein-(glutamine-N5) methyltransferase, release factor-specific [Rhodobiaceae bacterium]|nr:protein-(glutamine-N5) methyltransferase, release factor-specific [Rhodobiaceae bacterium]RPF97569.1 MAG: peptide chain release factor N(5)-glutamine methyltransferase [Rhizobiales bacterium TMED227]|tara:strand:+ start:486 stop:1340 length:855 start_codon:yes stop_codon:yes gene_type:complete
MHTISNVLRDAAITLKQYGVSIPDLDSKILLAHYLDVSKEYLIINNDMKLSAEQLKEYSKLINRRGLGEPTSKIIQRREFYGREFIVNNYVLDPRPDSELIIDVVKENFSKDKDIKILDLGTGSGCLIITLLLEFENSLGLGLDISEMAIKVASINAGKYFNDDRLSFVVSNWLQSINISSFDVIISNPPYIPNNQISKLSPEVKNFDPLLALDGGYDGLTCYENIIKQLKETKLNSETLIIMELFSENKDKVIESFITYGFDKDKIEILKDYNNKDRLIFINQ